MEQTKLKELIAALENIVDMLKSEVYSDPSAYIQHEQITDYDEVFVDDDDGYPD
jgi:hypothetical protein